MSDELTIIGIGSSAGGLEAITEMVGSLPTAPTASYVIAQHVSPSHKSLLKDLVARKTALKVEELAGETTPMVNVIYITPPGKDVVYQKSILRLVDPSPETAMPKPSVDRFLTSMAHELGEKAVAVILSGTGSDGSYGIRAIREMGGITIAQEPETAKYDGMPNSAIRTGCVDLILRPRDIGIHLKKILLEPRNFEELRQQSFQDTPLADLLQILYARTRVDFREYKQSTVGRRIERRMVALGIGSLEEFTQHCREDPTAVDALYRDLLISVTRFFRDPDQFELLHARVKDMLVQARDEPIRVWVAGCATGEEAYSIAMLLHDAMGPHPEPLKNRLQIFATDIDSEALNVARKGRYSLSVLNDIRPDMATKYLLQSEDGVQVVPELRNAILFSEHSVFQDPPFQKINLLCCRNVLIYFGIRLQQKVMSRFHFALRDSGIVFLGNAESVSGSEELFNRDPNCSHIFFKRDLRPRKDANIEMIEARELSISGRRTAAKVTALPTPNDNLFEKLVLALGQDGILVSEDLSIARVYGDISPFVALNESSKLRMHVDLLRNALREDARSLIALAQRAGQGRKGSRHSLNETTDLVLSAYPLGHQGPTGAMSLLVFRQIPAQVEPESGSVTDSGSAGTERERRLEAELAAARSALQQTVEELETSNEELQSINEELQSTNEELQSTNEELETSNEELQAANEELITVNEELQVAAGELSHRTGELASVLASTPVPMIVADSALQVVHATEQAAEMFGISQPIGAMHISSCKLPEGYPSLASICGDALARRETVTRDFVVNGNSIVFVCSPYLDSAETLMGVTLVVSEFPGMAEELDMLLKSSNLFVVCRSTTGEISRLSTYAAKQLGISRADAIGRNFYDLMDDGNAEQFRQEDAKLALEGGQFTEELSPISLGDRGETVWVRNTVYRKTSGGEQSDTIYSVGLDVSESSDARNAAEAQLRQIEMIEKMAGIGFWSLDTLRNRLLWSPGVYRIHRLNKNEYQPDLGTAMTFYHPQDAQYVTDAVQTAIDSGKEFRFVKRLQVGEQETVHVEAHGVAIRDDNGDVVRIAGVFREVPGTSPDA